MTRLCEPYHVEHVLVVTRIAHSQMISGAYVLDTDKGKWWLKGGVPRKLRELMNLDGKATVKVSCFENTSFIHEVLLITTARDTK